MAQSIAMYGVIPLRVLVPFSQCHRILYCMYVLPELLNLTTFNSRSCIPVARSTLSFLPSPQ